MDKYKLTTDQYNKERERALTALTKAEDLDIKRDTLIQNRVIKLAEVGLSKEENRIKREQAANNSNIVKEVTKKEAPPEIPDADIAPLEDLVKEDQQEDTSPAPGRMTR